MHVFVRVFIPAVFVLLMYRHGEDPVGPKECLLVRFSRKERQKRQTETDRQSKEKR
jgi:hypothetical protein